MEGLPPNSAEEETNELEDYHTLDLERQADAPPDPHTVDVRAPEVLPAAAARPPSEPAARDPFAQGAVLRERYCIEGVLGAGGSAIVYRARDLRWESEEDGCSHVAIKALRPELRGRPQSIARLKREFRQTRLLTHPNVVRVFDLDCHEDAWFMVMEQLDGRSLSAQLRASACLPSEQIKTILSACGAALQCAHAHGVVHGDLKPGNVFLLNNDEVRLLDFGASPESHSPAAATYGCAIPAAATPGYASPEVLASLTPEPRDDVFSLACIAHQLLTGQHPVDRTALAEHADSSLASQRWTLSARQLALIEAGLAPKRENRPESVAALLKFLEPDEPAKPVVTPEPATLIDMTANPAHAGPERSIENVTSAPIAEMAPVLSEPATRPLEQIQQETPQRRDHSAFALPTAHWAVIGAIALLGALAVASIERHEPHEVAVPVAATNVPTPNVNAGVPETHNTTVPEPVKPPLSTATPEKKPNAVTAIKPDAKAPARPAPSDAPKEAPKQEVSFDVSSLAVSARASAAVLTLKRANGRDGRVRVSWRVNDGTAIAGRDFSGPTSGVVELAHWQTVKSLYIPLIAAPGDISTRNFTVKITGVSGGARVASKDKVTVTIKDFG